MAGIVEALLHVHDEQGGAVQVWQIWGRQVHADSVHVCSRELLDVRVGEPRSVAKIGSRDVFPLRFKDTATREALNTWQVRAAHEDTAGSEAGAAAQDLSLWDHPHGVVAAFSRK